MKNTTSLGRNSSPGIQAGFCQPQCKCGDPGCFENESVGRELERFRRIATAQPRDHGENRTGLTEQISSATSILGVDVTPGGNLDSQHSHHLL